MAAKLLFVMSNWGFDCATGTIMCHAYKAFLMEVGLYGKVLSEDFVRARHLATEGTWFTNFWEFSSHL